MTSTETGVREARPRRLVPIVVAVVIVVIAIVAVIVAVVLRPATGVRVALEDDDFTPCLERQGTAEHQPSTDGAESFTQEEEVDFWSHPLALHCAVVALDEDSRARALAIAFPVLDGDDSASDVDEQWAPVIEYAGWLEAEEVPRDEAMLRLAGVLRALWISHAEHGEWADGFTNSAVLADMRARDELPGYDAWLADQDPDDNDRVDLFAYRSSVLEQAGDETEAAYRDYLDRSRALYDVVR